MDNERLRKKLEELKKKKENKWRDFWFPKEGPNEIRILPNWTGDLDADFFYETAYHKKLGPAKDKSVVCLKAEGEENCPICEIVSQLFSTKDKEDTAFAKEIKAQARVYWNIVDLSEPQKGVQPWMTGHDVMEQILEYCYNPKYGDLTDPVKGRNVTLKFTDAKNTRSNYNEYTVHPDPERSAISDPAWLDQMIDLKSLVKILPPEEMENILWGKETPKEVQSDSKQVVTEIQKSVVDVKKPCIGKFSDQDTECLSCVQKIECLNLRQGKAKASQTETSVKETPKEEPTKIETSSAIKAMLQKVRDKQQLKKV